MAARVTAREEGDSASGVAVTEEGGVSTLWVYGK